jgi:hypothetical protein
LGGFDVFTEPAVAGYTADMTRILTADDPLEPFELEEQQMFREHREWYGDTAAARACYLGDRARERAGIREQLVHRWPGAVDTPATILSFSFVSNGKWANAIQAGQPLDITLRLSTTKDVPYQVFASISLWTESGHRASRIQGPDDVFVGTGKPRPWHCRIDAFPFGEGTYDWTIAIYDVADRKPGGHGPHTRHDNVMRCHRMVVTDQQQIKAAAYPSATWTFR